MSQDNPQASLAAVTALTRLQAKPNEDLNNSNISANDSINSANSEFYEDAPKKSNLAKLKSSNVITRSELQDLNVKLGAYLDRAKDLERLNQRLLKEVEEARALKVPKNEDRKELANAVDQARIDLENESKDCVRHELNIEKDEGARQEYINRIKFYQAEADAQKQKIAKLLQELADISDEREYILRSARQVENDISREQNTMNRAENELDELRQKLADIKNKNKQLEFEMQTLQDEKEFCKAVHDEELTELKNLNKSIPSTRDLNKFYKDQLAQAVKDIKGDFRRLNQQQLDDLKAQKEEELANAKDIAQKQKAAAALRSAPDVSNVSLSDLPDISKQERDELRQLLAKNNDLQKHLANLEEELARQRANNADEAEKKDNELKELKDLNDNYLNELGYWDRKYLKNFL
jgi:intermediate filament protein if